MQDPDILEEFLKHQITIIVKPASHGPTRTNVLGKGRHNTDMPYGMGRHVHSWLAAIYYSSLLAV